MELIKAVTKKERELVKELYLKAFPKEERKPFDLIVQGQEQGVADILYIDDEGEFCGLAIPVIDKDIVLLVFFAITDNKRSGGYGSKALKMIMEKYKGKRFILEIEDTAADAENKEQRIRRKNFYIKNGLIATGFMINIMEVDMEVLGNTTDITFEEHRHVYENAFGRDISEKIRRVE